MCVAVEASYVAHLMDLMANTSRYDAKVRENTESMSLLQIVSGQFLISSFCMPYGIMLYVPQGSYGVLDLAASTIAMFSSRPTALPALLQAGAVRAMCRLLR